ncbi:hypothetical protein CBW54_00650 [Yersinia kristensenii]|nr:hypothetical protein CBW54_00650 [Yersinia kristensenii]
MKETKTRYGELLKDDQTWLTDFTRLAVRRGLCHQNISFSHHLRVDCLRFPGEEPLIAIVPQSLYRLIHGKSEPVRVSVEDDMAVSLNTQEYLLFHHPLLEGVLLSECLRLKQRSLANKLTNLFQQFSGTEIRLKLVWLCGYDLMLGAPLTEWVDTLKFKTKEEMHHWINTRQNENWALTCLMDEYVTFSHRATTDSSQPAFS